MKRLATFKDYVGELNVQYRRTTMPTVKITTSMDAANFLRPYFEECMDDHEQFKVIHLNRGNYVVNVHHLAYGSDTACIVDIKDLIRHTLHIKTHAIILCHNHPSGNLRFSDADIKITKRIMQASRFFDIECLDSLVITRESYSSMKDEGAI